MSLKANPALLVLPADIFRATLPFIWLPVLAITCFGLLGFRLALGMNSATRAKGIDCPSGRSRFKISTMAGQTPISWKARRRRQQVMPVPQPSSRGILSQAIRSRSTSNMPLIASRCGKGRLPIKLYWFSRRFGMSGSIAFHKAFEIILLERTLGDFCAGNMDDSEKCIAQVSGPWTRKSGK